MYDLIIWSASISLIPPAVGLALDVATAPGRRVAPAFRVALTGAAAAGPARAWTPTNY